MFEELKELELLEIDGGRCKACNGGRCRFCLGPIVTRVNLDDV